MMKIYDYYDKVSCTFSGNFGLFNNDATAIRTYKTLLAANKLPPLVCSNPGDFAIYCLGSFNQETGEIEAKKEMLINLMDLVEVKSDEQE